MARARRGHAAAKSSHLWDRVNVVAAVIVAITSVVGIWLTRSDDSGPDRDPRIRTDAAGGAPISGVECSSASTCDVFGTTERTEGVVIYAVQQASTDLAWVVAALAEISPDGSWVAHLELDLSVVPFRIGTAISVTSK